MTREGVPSNDERDTHDGVREDAARGDLPGSDGEHELQVEFGTADRADAFYEEAMQSSLTDRMRAFLAERWLGFVGSLSDGRPRATPAVGEPGLVRVLDDETVAWPTSAMLGDGPHVDGAADEQWLSLVTVDWWDSTVGLHVNGTGERRAAPPPAVDDAGEGSDWVVLSIEEAYIHCAKHVPRLAVEESPPDDSAPEGPLKTHDRLLADTRQFVGSRVLGFLATADGDGETDVSPRLGPEGFVQVLDDTTLAWPEYRGNGVHASLGNVVERPVASLLFVDWWATEAVVQVSGTVSLHEEVEGAVDPTDVDRTKTWVVLDVEDVTVDVNPPLPRLSIEAFDPPWGTDDTDAKKSGFFVG